MAHGEYNHIEIPADDLERAERFYSGVFGWQISSMEEYPNYLLYRVGSVGGGIGKRNDTAGPVVRNYIEVDSLDEAARKVEELGGKVTLARAEIAGMGWYAVVNDSEGNEIALWENAPGTGEPSTMG